MSQVPLDCPRVVAVIGELVAGRVPEHMAVDQKGEFGSTARPRDHPLISSNAEWRTAFADEDVDGFRRGFALQSAQRSHLLADDARAHAREHSLEVQLPFLQQILGDFTFVPICLGANRYDYCEEIGGAIAAVVAAAGEPVGILASSDLNHYEDQKTTLRKDQLAIDEVLKLDPRGLWRAVEQHDISMCGFIPTTTMMIAAAYLGAKDARLIKHATSGDINGDYAHVVGYAAIVIN